MPYPNEHAARIKSPLPSDSAVYARKNIAPGVSIILQRSKSKPSAPMQIQAYRFSKKKFTADQARIWLKKHKIGIMFFEPASND